MILVGQKVKCKVTGVTGIVDHRVEYMHSAPRLAIVRGCDEGGKLLDAMMVDECQVELIDPNRVVSIDAPPARFEFGQKVKDPISKFCGGIVARAVYLNGCARVCIQPELDKEGKFLDSVFFNEDRVEPVGKLIAKPKVESRPERAGPNLDAPRGDMGFAR